MSFVAAGIGAGVNIIGGIIGNSSANASARAAREEKERLSAELNRLENSRQAIVNPWATTKDMSSLIKDSSSLVTNAFANLGVATQASKFEAEQIDISLANTLDTLRETGSSAGGATALANAALKAKQGISANIEQQEAKNDQLRAKGQQDLERVKLAEAQRTQAAQLSEAQRVQGAEAAGAQFVFNATENREQQKIDRIAGLLGAAGNREAQANANATSAITGAISGIGGIASSVIGAGGFGGSKPATPSDRRLKKNINIIGKSKSGLNVYSFEYKDTKYGNGLYQGVMADEMHPNVIIKGKDGYNMVDYSLLDVEFKQI